MNKWKTSWKTSWGASWGTQEVTQPTKLKRVVNLPRRYLAYPRFKQSKGN